MPAPRRTAPGWPDPSSDPPLELTLDPAVSPSDNLRRAWQRHRKADRGRRQAEEKLRETETALEKLDDIELGLDELRESLEEFPDDFMEGGRDQGDHEQREPF